MSQQESAPYKRHIQIGCAAFILLLVTSSYFSWMRMRRLYGFRLPPDMQIYQITPGQDVGDVTVDFALPQRQGIADEELFREVLALNPGDGTPVIEKNNVVRKDSDKVIRVTYSEAASYYTLVIDRKE